MSMVIISKSDTFPEPSSDTLPELIAWAERHGASAYAAWEGLGVIGVIFPLGPQYSHCR